MIMKTNTTTIVRVDQTLLSEIQQEVRETIAVDVALPVNKQVAFCAADLWKIHRQKRQRSTRRFL